MTQHTISNIYTSSFEAVLKIRKRFPDAQGVAVCAFGIVTSYYTDNYTTHVADLEYWRDGRPGALFGYDYRLVWKKR